MIYTVGYTGLNVDQLKKWAENHNARVVDIRISPRSRNLTWTRKRLTEKLGDNYTHIPALGNASYKGGDIQLKAPQQGAQQVKSILDAGQDVILMCVCQTPDHCHRTPAAAVVANITGDDIFHLTQADINDYGKPEQNQLF